MSNPKKKNEEEVFLQSVDDDELDDVSGGDKVGATCSKSVDYDCRNNWARYIYQGGFPNCAASVEDGSWCGSNDACFDSAVKYLKMNDCNKAWK